MSIEIKEIIERCTKWAYMTNKSILKTIEDIYGKKVWILIWWSILINQHSRTNRISAYLKSTLDPFWWPLPSASKGHYRLWLVIYLIWYQRAILRQMIGHLIQRTNKDHPMIVVVQNFYSGMKGPLLTILQHSVFIL